MKKESLNHFSNNTGIASGSDRFIHDSGKIVLAGENVQKIRFRYHAINRIEQGINNYTKGLSRVQTLSW